MNSKKVGICTLFTGYNFGSALQAYATKMVVKKLGFEPHMIKLSGSVVTGRDIRIKKVLCTFVRMLLHSKNKKKVFRSFTENGKSTIDSEAVKKFDEFYAEELKPLYISYNGLKKEAQNPGWQAFICGSDQIWNSTSFYVDPFYYLDFAPVNKRIAYAPSFGRDYISKYNERIIKKHLNNIRYLSIREATGKKLIKSLIGKDVNVCLDPTLLLNKDDWDNAVETYPIDDEDYVLCYFLNEPNDKAKKFIGKVLKKYGAKKAIFVNKPFGNDVKYCGPKEFLNYLRKAKVVVTDSFHGVAFSLNYNKDFFVFDRQYLTDDQSTRIKSILEMVGLLSVFECDDVDAKVDYNFDKVNKIISDQRKSSLAYLTTCLKGGECEK